MADPVEEFDAYRQELLDALGGRDPIEVMREGLKIVRELVATAPMDSLSKPPAPGEWSAHQVLQHLADTEFVYGFRSRMILTHDKPLLVSYDQNSWVDRFAGLDEDPFRALDFLRVLREGNVRIYQSMTEEEKDRTGIHSDWGEISIRTILEMLGGHSIIHVEQMRRALLGNAAEEVPAPEDGRAEAP